MSYSTKKFTKKDLYEFDDSYLKELNSIRKKLNLLEISDETKNEEPFQLSTTSIQPSPENDFNPELYECNSDYMAELNAIRRQLNLGEIENPDKIQNNLNDKKEKRFVRFQQPVVEAEKSNKISSSSNKNRRKSKHKPRKIVAESKGEVLQLLYIPPKKKKCLESKSEHSLVNCSVSSVRTEEENDVVEDALSPTSKVGECASPQSRPEGDFNNQPSTSSSSKVLKIEKHLGSQRSLNCFKHKNDNNEPVPDSPVSGPSEDSSPVLTQQLPQIDPSAIILKNDFHVEPQILKPTRFCSLNVPSYDLEEQRRTLKANVTVLSNENMIPRCLLKPKSKKESVITIFTNADIKSEDNLGLMSSSLDIPRKSEEFYEFPSIVNISKWPLAFTAQYNVNNIHVNASKEGHIVKKYDFWTDKKLDDGRRRRIPMELSDPEKASTSDETIERIEARSHLTPMHDHYEKQSLDINFYNMQSQDHIKERSEKSDSDVEEEEETKRKFCKCFNICFSRKRRRYFS